MAVVVPTRRRRGRGLLGLLIILILIVVIAVVLIAVNGGTNVSYGASISQYAADQFR